MAEGGVGTLYHYNLCPSGQLQLKFRLQFLPYLVFLQVARTLFHDFS